MTESLLTTLAWPVLVDAAVKGTGVLLFAYLLERAWRGASASGRHMLWALTMAGLLAVPVMAWLVPAWQLPESFLNTAMLPHEAGPLNVQLPSEMGSIAKSEPASSPRESPAASPVLVASRGATPPSALPTEAARASADVPPAVSPFGGWVVAFWLGGFLLSAAGLVGGWLSLARLGRRCERIHEGRLYEMAAQVAANLGIRRRVQVLLSDSRAIPMTWGMVRPVVLLPREAESWTSERLRMVLVHELGHIQRWDCLTQMLAHLARGVYWFHPLAWFGVSRLRLEQEQACDDLVLQSGASGPDYAEHLVAVTAGLSTNRWVAPVALSMSRTQKLNRRLVSVLDGNRNHRPLGRRSLVVAVAMALGIVAPLATMGLTPAVIAAQEAAQKQEKSQPAGKETASTKTIVEVQNKLAQHYVAPVDEKALTEHALKGLLQALKDPYTAYISSEDLAKLENDIKGALTGIGAQLQMTDDRLTVTTPLEGSPALKAGIRPGDIIDAIDGKSTRGLALPDAVKRILGPAGSIIKLKILHTDGVLEEIVVTRGEIRVSTINGFRRGADGKWEYMLDGDHKIGYLHINQFGSRTAADARQTLEGLQKDGMKALILDLRFCPGGLLDQAIEICKLFMKDGLILTTRGPGKEERAFRADGGKALGDFPLLVMLNDQSASAAEIVAGSLRDNGRATLLGTRSFGKGSVQSIMKLDEGGALKMTTANHYMPSGRNIQKRPGEKSWGVDPTDGFYIPLTAAQTAALVKDAKNRSVIGLKKDNAAPLAKLTPTAIEETHADPQLAGALQTTVARLTGGEFIKVGKDLGVLADQAPRLEEMRQRREQLQQSLQQLDRDIADLQQATGKEK